MIESPSNLELLLHCYYSGEVHPRYDAPAIQAGLEYLRQTDMIMPVSIGARTHKVTARGEFYIKYLMTIPFPVVTYEIPNSLM